MIQISDKTKCCGCTACASVCPKNCISMQCDGEGFLYPVRMVLMLSSMLTIKMPEKESGKNLVYRIRL